MRSQFAWPIMHSEQFDPSLKGGFSKRRHKSACSSWSRGRSSISSPALAAVLSSEGQPISKSIAWTNFNNT